MLLQLFFDELCFAGDYIVRGVTALTRKMSLSVVARLASRVWGLIKLGGRAHLHFSLSAVSPFCQTFGTISDANEYKTELII